MFRVRANSEAVREAKYDRIPVVMEHDGNSTMNVVHNLLDFSSLEKCITGTMQQHPVLSGANQLDSVLKLREYFSFLVSSQNIDVTFTPLMYAALYKQQDDIFSALKILSPEMNPNQQNHQGLTALMIAILGGHAHHVASLKKSFPKIDPNVQSVEGLTSLTLAVQKGDVDCVIALHQCFGNEIDINMQNEESQTALTIATSKNYSKCIQVLYECYPHIDPDVKTRKGETAMMIAAAKGNHESLEVLFRCFPTMNINETNINGVSSLHLAAKNGHTACILFLLNNCCSL